MTSKVLVVHSNPRSNETSHSWKIVQAIQNKLSTLGNVEVIDLYRDNNFPIIDEQFFNSSMFPVVGYKKDEGKTTRKVSIARQFANASKVIIITPFWTGLFPSLLKNWIDLLAEQEITLTVDSSGKLVGKFKGTVSLIQTCGGLMKNNSHNYGADLIKDNMNFYGAKDFKSIMIEQVDEMRETDLIENINKFLLDIY